MRHAARIVGGVDAELELERALADLRGQQDRIVEIQDELSAMELTGYADRGAIAVMMTGAGRFTDVQFDPEALRYYDAYELGKAVLAAIHDVVGQLATQTKEKFAEIIPDADALDLTIAEWHPDR